MTWQRARAMQQMAYLLWLQRHLKETLFRALPKDTVKVNKVVSHTDSSISVEYTTSGPGWY